MARVPFTHSAGRWDSDRRTYVSSRAVASEWLQFYGGTDQDEGNGNIPGASLRHAKSGIEVLGTAMKVCERIGGFALI